MPYIKQVYEQVRELKELLEELKGLVLQERKDITGLDLAGLAERRNDIEKLMVQVKQQNERTSELVTLACRDAGITEEISLSSLITVVPKPDREQFAKLQKSILKISTEAYNALKVNSGVLEDSLALTTQSLSTFSGMLKNNSTYGQSGRYVESVNRFNIINREI
jgi:hypothetical protein